MTDESKYEISKGEVYCGVYSELLRYFREFIKVGPCYNRDEIEKAAEGYFELSSDLTIEAQLDRIKKLDRHIGRVIYLKCKYDKTKDLPNIVLSIESPFVYIRDEEIVKAVENMLNKEGTPPDEAA